MPILLTETQEAVF